MQKLFQKIKKSFLAEAGVTLVELIIAITVMVMMLGISAIYLPTYRANQMKKQAALDINDSLRFAQSLASSPESEEIEYYHWHYDTDAKDVTVTDNNGEHERAFNLDADDKIEVVTNLEDIYIKTKTPAMYSDPALTTLAAGSIQVYHIAQKDVNNVMYQISVTNNSFNLTREVIGETEDGANDSGYIRTPGQ